jgi:DnaJ family protein A protein 2
MDPDAGRKFQEMASACVSLLLFQAHLTNIFNRYEILSETRSRATYDAHGMAGLATHGDPDGMNPADVFAEFFFGGGHFEFDPAGSNRRKKGQDTIIPYDVTLGDLYNGKSVKMNLEKEVLCGTCKG